MRYREIEIVGKKYVRPLRVVIEGFADPAARRVALFAEEEIIEIDSLQERAPAPVLVSNLMVVEDAAPFPLRDSSGRFTGETGTQAQLYALLVSLYWHHAQARDAREDAVEPPVVRDPSVR